MLYQTQNIHGGDIYSQPVTLDFSANVNPYGTPPAVLDAIRKALPALFCYPDPRCSALVQAISQREEVPPAYVLCGNGAADLIYAYCQALGPRSAVETAPTFSEYSLALAQAGCRVDRYLLQQRLQFDVDTGFVEHVRQTAPDVIFLCSPNNPTGRLIPQPLLLDLVRYCRESGARLFVDECFIELSGGGRSLTGLLDTCPQLFILKAFTKNYGMAGLRLGYGLSADSELLRAMSQAVQPWNVSSLAQAAGVAAFGDRSFLDKTRALIAAERPWLCAQLQRLGLWVCDSAANFLLFQGPPGLHTALLEQGIAIRSCDNYYGLGPGWYRIAVRLHHQNQTLIAAIAAALGRERSWQKTL